MAWLILVDWSPPRGSSPVPPGRNRASALRGRYCFGRLLWGWGGVVDFGGLVSSARVKPRPSRAESSLRTPGGRRAVAIRGRDLLGLVKRLGKGGGMKGWRGWGVGGGACLIG